MEIITTLVIGAIAGWLGSFIFKGKGLGILWNIVLGIAGGWVGSWIFGELKIRIGDDGWIGAIITGAVGAIVLLAIANLLFGIRKK